MTEEGNEREREDMREVEHGRVKISCVVGGSAWGNQLFYIYVLSFDLICLDIYVKYIHKIHFSHTVVDT